MQKKDPFSATRREVLGALMSAPYIPSAGTAEMAALVANPTKAMIHIFGLGGALKSIETAVLQTFVISPARPPSQWTEFQRDLRLSADPAIRTPRHTVDNVRLLMQLKYRRGLDPAAHINRLGLGEAADDFALLEPLVEKVRFMGGDILQGCSLSRGKRVSFEYALQNILHDYRRDHGLQRSLEKAVRANPAPFKKALAQLANDFPYAFTEDGPLSLKNGLALIERMRAGDLPLPEPDVLDQKFLEALGRFTGEIPNALSQQGKARLSRLFEDPEYTPYFSKKAALERAEAQVKQHMQEHSIHAEHATEEMLFLQPDASGFYDENPGKLSLPAMDLSGEENTLRRLLLLIEYHFPVTNDECVLSSAARLNLEQRCTLKNHLRVHHPSPALAEWMASLNDPSTRVTAIERLQAIAPAGRAI